MATQAETGISHLRQVPLVAALCALLTAGSASAVGLVSNHTLLGAAGDLRFSESPRTVGLDGPAGFARNVAIPAANLDGSSNTLMPSSVTLSGGSVAEHEGMGVQRHALQHASHTSDATDGESTTGTYAFRVVHNCNDSGSGSLREAIEGSTGTFTEVEFDNGLSCSTITLTSGAIQASMADLHIDGPGAPPFGSITIIASNSDTANNRIIRHTGSGTLSVSRVSMQGGSYAGSGVGNPVNGGCIYSLGTVDLGQMSLSGCSVVGDWSAEGGAVWGYEGVDLGAVTIESSFALVIDDEGNTSGTGGGVFTHGSLRITGSHLINNTAGASGGGAWASDRVVIERSTFSGNEAKYGHGGGIAMSGDDGLYDSLIDRSTFSGNSAVSGGAIYFGEDLFGSAPLRISNSTISGNEASDVVGGIFVSGGTVFLESDTIAFNYAANGSTAEYPFVFSGLFIDQGNGDIQNTIIANNHANGTVPADASSSGFFDISGSDNLMIAATNNIIGVEVTADPQLLQLRNNGGWTETHALALGSPAVDAGHNTNDEFSAGDQRGHDYPRVIGDAADIGAFEKQGPADGDRIFADGFDF